MKFFYVKMAVLLIYASLVMYKIVSINGEFVNVVDLRATEQRGILTIRRYTTDYPLITLDVNCYNSRTRASLDGMRTKVLRSSQPLSSVLALNQSNCWLENNSFSLDPPTATFEENLFVVLKYLFLSLSLCVVCVFSVLSHRTFERIFSTCTQQYTKVLVFSRGVLHETLHIHNTILGDTHVHGAWCKAFVDFQCRELSLYHFVTRNVLAL